MEERWIGPVRPMFDLSEEPPKNKRVERLVAGSPTNGMIIDVTRDGLELNAYYTGFQGDSKYSVLRSPVVIPWDDIFKIKDRIQTPKRKKLAVKDRIEGDVDKEYLKTLPVVTINGRKYYIDPDRRERRAKDVPEEVWRF